MLRALRNARWSLSQLPSDERGAREELGDILDRSGLDRLTHRDRQPFALTPFINPTPLLPFERKPKYLERTHT